jgi:hypothetical protein
VLFSLLILATVALICCGTFLILTLLIAEPKDLIALAAFAALVVVDPNVVFRLRKAEFNADVFLAAVGSRRN